MENNNNQNINQNNKSNNLLLDLLISGMFMKLEMFYDKANNDDKKLIQAIFSRLKNI